AARVVFPANAGETADVLAQATRERTPVTVAGAGTGIVGGRVPFGGIVLSTDRLNRIKEIVRGDAGGHASAEAGVVLADFQRAVRERGLIYPPDPTEWSCYLGGTIATNASGARSFKYGATRNFVRRLKSVLATGDILDLRRGDYRADSSGLLRLPLPGGRVIEARLPSYRMPQTRKHASGYYVAPGVDAVDLFIGSEGTLGVISEVEVRLLPVPEGVLCGVVFFRAEESLLAFVRDARAASIETRERNKAGGMDARALEYFDAESLQLLRNRYPRVPEEAAGAIFFEQETTALTEESSQSAWLALLERHGALLDDSWFATNEADRREMREFRHQLPVLVNEWLSRQHQRKVSTDMAVPDAEFAAMLRFYQETLRASGLKFVIFGHIGDNHVHVNILPRDEDEAARARDTYMQFVRRAILAGGTVSAEHGIGKLKREYLRLLYDEKHLREMAQLKRAFDPACILGRGNILGEEYLA
ncbi:MAG TPA: FAD-linked oxidase C-terminal domain-containing protein, partial [Pyrinomonadaceae bacterium]|nr:FAD-linked oxidase C-terminal domain-containing protein [Pyrinomonadaceae bacterium]